MSNDRERAESLNKFMLYTLTEIEPILGVSHQTLLRYVKSGQLKANKINGKWRVNQEQLNDYINGR